MNKQRSQLKILLLQIRDDKETMIEEFYEFVQFSGLHEEQFTVLNTFHTPEFKPVVIEDYDALFVGGSSDATVLKPEEYPFVHACNDLMQHCYDSNIPVLASCFGFQIAVEHFGGKVIVDKEHMEVGSYPIYLTEQAKEDPLMYDMPNPFWAIVGHKERALRLPENVELLAYSKDCPYQAIKFNNKPFYGFQFHPEVDKKDLIARITRYQDRYLEEDESMDKVIKQSTHDTPQSNQLVRHFIDRVVLQVAEVKKEANTTAAIKE